ISVDWLEPRLRSEYNILDELVSIAGSRSITVHEPFAGDQIGPFVVLSPIRELYPALLAQFDRIPCSPNEERIRELGCWIGKRPMTLLEALTKAARAAVSWIFEDWDSELLREGGVTSATNESSVVLFAQFDVRERVLLTGDAGQWALLTAAAIAERLGKPL